MLIAPYIFLLQRHRLHTMPITISSLFLLFLVQSGKMARGDHHFAFDGVSCMNSFHFLYVTCPACHAHLFVLKYFGGRWCHHRDPSSDRYINASPLPNRIGIRIIWMAYFTQQNELRDIYFETKTRSIALRAVHNAIQWLTSWKKVDHSFAPKEWTIKVMLDRR